MSESRSAHSETITEQVLRRVLETENECRAAIWLKNRRTGEWYEWDTCNQEPGHEGPHEVWCDRDSTDWAKWDEGGRATSRYVDLDQEQRLEPSPWTAEELGYLREDAR